MTMKPVRVLLFGWTVLLLTSGCITPAQLRQAATEPIHLVAVLQTGPDELSGPERRRLIDAELASEGAELTPLVIYRVPGNDLNFRVDLASLGSRIEELYELSFREELGARLVPAEETASLPGIRSVTTTDRFKSFVAAQRSGTYLLVRLAIEPDLTYPRVSSEIRLEDDQPITFKASENVPRIVRIYLSSRLDLRTPEHPSRNILRFRFNRKYTRTGTPGYRTEILRAAEAFIVSEPPGPVVVFVNGGSYLTTVQQDAVAQDLMAAATLLGSTAAQRFTHRVD